MYMAMAQSICPVSVAGPLAANAMHQMPFYYCDLLEIIAMHFNSMTRWERSTQWWPERTRRVLTGFAR